MVKISIDHAPAYTSPNSMTLICTEKPDGSREDHVFPE